MGQRNKPGKLAALFTVILLFALCSGCAALARQGAVGSLNVPGPDRAAVEKPEVPSPVQAILAEMTLREKVLQMFIVTPQQRAGAAQSNQTVGGIICFADDLQTPEQVTRMIEGLQEASPIGLFISVDEEGGSVARLGSNDAMGTTKLPAMGTITTVEEARQVGLTLATDLKRFGFNLDFAPVADVNSNPANPVIGARAFSSDPHTAAALVAACVEGFEAGGVLCTLKHFPGHGDTAADSHVGAAVSNQTLEELEACELLPFQSGIAAGADLVMVGHISLPAVTGDDIPATLSYDITTKLLRQQLGFEGVVITDSMSMGAITNRFSSAEAAVKAIQAGIDIILMPEELDAAVEGILTAVAEGELPEGRIDESVNRILALKLEQGMIA